MAPEGTKYSPIFSMKHQERGDWEGRTPTLIKRKGMWKASLNAY